MVDLLLLKGDSELLEDICVIGGQDLRTRIVSLCSVIDQLPRRLFSVQGTTLRRLSWFPDKENKVRVVAILDYWSQTALKAVHDYLFRVLRKIPQDCTFDQGSFKERVKDWKVFYSIDLTNATDRFPIYLISQVLKGLLPSEFVNSWERIMVKHPFDFQGRKISYAVGNPMGAYSSWNSFTLSHHYVMYWCCRELGIPWRDSKYCILGDDVLIGDSSLAMKYKEAITLLGVDFSPMKTHESSRLFEFAKRLFLDGEEVTPFPISALPEVSKTPSLLTSLLVEEERRGWTPPRGIPLTVSEFYGRVLCLGSKVRAKTFEVSLLSELIIKFMRGSLLAKDTLTGIIRHWSLPLYHLADHECMQIIQGCVKDIFLESNPLDHKRGKPLGQLAEELVCELTSVEYPDIVACSPWDIPSYIPLLNVYGQIEEKYVNIVVKVNSPELQSVEGWPLSLRTMAIPLSDKVFSERTSHTMVRLGATLGKRILLVLKGLHPPGLAETLSL